MRIIHVAISGNDLTGTGASAAPFGTISKASKTAATGDTIYITAGTYHETIIPQVDGVTYTGELGPNRELLTIIDPSMLVDSNKWTSAPRIGPNVWQARLRYRPGIFTYNGQCIESVGEKPQLIDPVLIDPVSGKPRIITLNAKERLTILAKEYNSIVKSGGTLWHDVRFWDGPVL